MPPEIGTKIATRVFEGLLISQEAAKQWGDLVGVIADSEVGSIAQLEATKRLGQWASDFWQQNIPV